MFTIREFRQGDWPEVCRIHDAARRDELKGSCDERGWRPLAEVAEKDGFHDSSIWVACEGGGPEKVVAFAGVELEDHYVSWLYVDPAYYRRGVGMMLLRHALSVCGPEAWTHCVGGNTAALALYQREGFQVVRAFASECEGWPCVSVRLAVPTSSKRWE
jgi:GNAT superfamily N-acetyltransferase